MDRSAKRCGNRNPAADLTDDLVVEILSRLPAKSVCRFKCVSQHWLHDLIAHPNYRANLPQTLTGFFRCIDMPSPSDGSTMSSPDLASGDDDDDDEEDEDIADEYDSGDDAPSVPDFVSIVKEHQVVSPSLSFLPSGLYRSVAPRHCSNGLLVCLCWKASPRNEADYVVCNPATEQWVVLPGNGHTDRSEMQLHLAVDPASSSGHFHLFALQKNEHGYLIGADIYSSKTRAWSYSESGWVHEDMLCPVPHSVFFHGMLYFVTLSSTIVTVDTEGTTTWSTISMQETMDDDYSSQMNAAFVGVSQGRLHYLANRRSDESKLSVWVLGDDDEWTFKYNISTTSLFGAKLNDLGDYSLVAIHPECSTIFFTVRADNILLSYHMDRGEVRVLGSLISYFDGWSRYPYLPYVPSFRSIA
ncbi:hypothetical protein QYE76_066142 [Lolium multiflorum]|uniref:F-box domain-containing protein n=1 Tax=Lolium multiflorum TaxID=4521 RepID=A0AAD8SA14_LOLMU|nr:hypothetical protein QYE76_066142 [Lolium multiflorum]